MNTHQHTKEQLKTVTYKNPILSGFHPDPSICRVGDTYYLITSTFEYFPGVPIFKSKNLVDWNQIGYCLTRPSQLKLNKTGSSGGIYAPTLRYHNNLFYMVTTNVSDRGNFYVTAEDPAGEWSDPIWVDQPGIDPDLFFDEDGSVYFTTSYGGDGAYQSRIDIHTGERLTDYKRIWTGTGGQYPEAPHMYKIGDYYYLMIAEGGTEYGHMVTIARSKQPEGPYESCPGNPILTHRSQSYFIQATGHADFVQTEHGDWWAVFLGIRPIGYPRSHHLGRETYLAPVTWNEQGWPVIGDQGTVSEEMSTNRLPGGYAPKAVSSNETIRDDFDTPELSLSWNFLRNPYSQDWSLTEKPGSLTLRGSAVTLNDVDSPAFVGQRQRHFDCSVSALLEFNPENEGEEAGLTIRANEKFHYEIAILNDGGQRKLIQRRRIGSLWKVEHEQEWNQDRVILSIQADEKTYKFGYAKESNPSVTTLIGEGECAFLGTEVAGGFTGVYFAMYATGNGKKAQSPAHFEWFEYKFI
ncbi:glycoside hydrolase family 43 protein [Paenibacillus lemnae]|uniref:Glycoside hydrolase family 43 protein n=1 Tax=Paenibacillus lemnae TaxID=1330551 RepID=A0A848MAG9_PAELE|nr:glycoside hydrolase family 43 protein [Paenibacillus lemnae]NMO97665.1 glycoside hydrolase family 43 protein [Paenibacillus lemnae]